MHIEIYELRLLMVFHPDALVFFLSGCSNKESMDETGYAWATVEKETLCLLVEESGGKLYKVAVAGCMCKVLVPQVKQLLI